MTAPTGGSPPLTPSQSRPIEVRQTSVALTAGAGCGKTTVLTARFLSHLEPADSLTLRSIVALTFTEKSARELRQRIRVQAREKLSTGDDVAYWRRILRGLEAAPVGTFHQYCGAWLRKHAIDAGLDPDFTILDASIAGTIRDEAIATKLRGWLASSDQDLIALAVEFSLRSVREALGDLLAHRAADDLAQWSQRTPDEIVDRWKTVWNSLERPRLVSAIADALRRCCMFLAGSGLDHPKLVERSAILAERLGDFELQVETEGWLNELRELAKVPAGLRKTAWPSEAVNEAAKGSFETVRKAIETFTKKATWNENSALVAAEQGLRFARLALDARRAYDAAKRAIGGLDFDDLLLKTRDLLRVSDGKTRAEMVGAIEFLLVDEFQDTDPVQTEILKHLSGHGFAEGRLFLVGDPKQSIYRFRGAQPEIFQQFRAQFPKAGHHDLSENFRSVPGVLDFVNALFDEALEEPGRPLVPGASITSPRGEPAVEFLWASEPTAKGQPKPSPREARKVEARWLARYLKRILLEEWPIRDRKKNVVRPAKAKDVVLLFRAMTDIGPYEAALHQEGIDYHTIGGAAFFAQQEITDLVNVLSVIEDPFDEVALAGTLRSPFFCMSDDGLFLLANEPGSLPDRLRRADEIVELSDRDRGHAVRARVFLDRWRGRKDREPIAALVNRVLDESGYEAALLGEFLGARKRANARKLVRMARAFDEQGSFTLAQFVAKLRSDLRNPPREEQASTTDEEGTSVRLMSIHQAKGLEFPIVVVPDLNRAANRSTGTVAFDPELGLLVRLSSEPTEVTEGEEAAEGAGESLGWRIFDARERREDDAEALRLFYVATTRAMDLLILSAGASPADKPKSPAMKLLDARFDRESGTRRVPLPEGWAEPRVRVVVTAPEPLPQPDRERPWRPGLHEVAQTIDSAIPHQEIPSQALPRRPRFVDLDPTLTLPPSLARLDGLVRMILRDPKSLSASELPALARRAARSLSPTANWRLVNEAVEQLTPWLEGQLGDELRKAKAVERGLEWSLEWPADVGTPTVFHGRYDIAFQDSLGEWRIVNVCQAAAPKPRERLRLLLSARAAVARALQPVRQAWNIRLGSDDGRTVVSRFEDEAIRDAIQELWNRLEPAAQMSVSECD